jgi:hypothetical protein
MATVTAEEIRSLDGKAISLGFTDGCAMDVRVIETLHLDEGDDFIADVLKMHCRSSEHWHPEVGTAINIGLADIVELKRLE